MVEYKRVVALSEVALYVNVKSVVHIRRIN